MLRGRDQEQPGYDGENLSRRGDVVVVSMNHRLGTFGFLNLAEAGGDRYASSGNVGMIDLVLSLEWVRDNIANFGGDPQSVMIFGQSGGGGRARHTDGYALRKRLISARGCAERFHFKGRRSAWTPDELAAAVLKQLDISPSDVDQFNGSNRQTAPGRDHRAAEPYASAVTQCSARELPPSWKANRLAACG